MTDAAPARAHLLELRTKGVGYRQAARLAGVSPSVVKRIRSGQVATVRHGTALAILAVRPALARGQKVNAYDTRRLIRAIVKEGYTQRDIALRVGLRSGRFRWDSEGVRVELALKVRALWRELNQ